jgi:hypothetical protein
VEADRVVVDVIDAFAQLDPAERQARIIGVRLNLDNLEKTRMTFLK